MSRVILFSRVHVPVAGGGTHPFDICLDLDNPARPIGLGEGGGHGAMGCVVPLSDLLLPLWSHHLQVCRCEWLRDLAAEEQVAGRCFTPAEIRARWELVKAPGSAEP
ncbi:MAG: hypothetical protein ACO1QS_07680 [Verrucomicrobiota bacterium]